MNSNISYERYQRQMQLKNFGEAGQQKLLQAKVLVVGAGGLGCPALQYLAAAGIGTLGIVDDDKVSLSNLHRQVLYSVNDIGLPKAETAAVALKRLNPEIEIISYTVRLHTRNALAIMEQYDIIIDGTDNFPSRYMMNDACVLLNKPLVYGAVSQYQGQVAIFNASEKINSERVNYRDLFPHPPTKNEVMNCEEAGVLGVLPGIIGNMQANETIKLITGIGKPLINRLLTYNALNNEMYELELAAATATRSLIPADQAAFEKMDYEGLCGSMGGGLEIDHILFDDLIASGNIKVIDVREMDEIPVIDEFAVAKIPLNQLVANLSLMNAGTIITICQSGSRSLQAARQLTAVFGSTKKICSLQGGIVEWKRMHAKELL